MKNIAITAIFTSTLMAFGPQTALAQVAEASAAAAAPLSGARLVGQGVLRFLGFEIYRARLWVQPGFDADNYAAHKHAALKDGLKTNRRCQRRFTPTSSSLVQWGGTLRPGCSATRHLVGLLFVGQETRQYPHRFPGRANA